MEELKQYRWCLQRSFSSSKYARPGRHAAKALQNFNFLLPFRAFSGGQRFIARTQLQLPILPLPGFLGHGAYSFLNSLLLTELIATARVRSPHTGKYNADPRLMIAVW